MLSNYANSCTFENFLLYGNLQSSGSCGTESKALRESKKIAHTPLPTSSSFSQLSVHFIRAVVVDQPSSKPHCLFEMRFRDGLVQYFFQGLANNG